MLVTEASVKLKRKATVTFSTDTQQAAKTSTVSDATTSPSERPQQNRFSFGSSGSGERRHLGSAKTGRGTDRRFSDALANASAAQQNYGGNRHADPYYHQRGDFSSDHRRAIQRFSRASSRVLGHASRNGTSGDDAYARVAKGRFVQHQYSEDLPSAVLDELSMPPSDWGLAYTYGGNGSIPSLDSDGDAVDGSFRSGQLRGHQDLTFDGR